MAFVNVKFGERRVKLRESSLTVRNLSLVFKLEPNSIYLTSEDEEIVVTDENGLFEVNAAVNNYLLHGDPVQATNTNVQSSQVPAFMPRSRLNPPPTARPRFAAQYQASGSTSITSSSTTSTAANVPWPRKQKSNAWKKAFIHVHADENQRVTEKCQLHIPLSEETAGVEAIKTMLKEQIGSDVELLDSKFLPIVESELTKGIFV